MYNWLTLIGPGGGIPLLEKRYLVKISWLFLSLEIISYVSIMDVW